MSHNFNGCFSFAFLSSQLLFYGDMCWKKKMKWLTFIMELAFVWSLMCSGNINSYHSLSLSNATQLIKLKTFPNYFISNSTYFISLLEVVLRFNLSVFEWKNYFQHKNFKNCFLLNTFLLTRLAKVLQFLFGETKKIKSTTKFSWCHLNCSSSINHPFCYSCLFRWESTWKQSQ